MAFNPFGPKISHAVLPLIRRTTGARPGQFDRAKYSVKSARDHDKDAKQTVTAAASVVRLLHQLPPTTKITTATLREQIDEIAQHTPRYLFRAWSSRSGGRDDSKLNTLDAITPLAFHNRDDAPASIYDLSREKLGRLAFEHLGALEAEKTVFSSWSCSLTWTLQYAETLSKQGRHISVIDTEKLHKHNVAMYTPVMHHLYPDLGHANYLEFLVFGVVSGSAHKAVATNDLEECGMGQLMFNAATPSPLSQYPEDLRDVLERAHAVGALFGDKFALVVAVYLLSARKKNAEDQKLVLAALLATAGDEDLASAGSDNLLHGVFAGDQIIPNDSHRAIPLLQAIASEQS